MGYRAHVLKKQIVEYGYGDFNWAVTKLSDFLYNLNDEVTDDKLYLPFNITDESGGVKDHWEIEREWLEKAVEYMKEKKDKNDIAFKAGDTSYLYRYVIQTFEDWLLDSSNKENFTYPEYVYIEWF